MSRLKITYRYQDIEILAHPNVAVPDEYSAFLADYIPAGDGLALDVTTGSGFHAIVLAKRGYKVFATDISVHAVDAARQNALRNAVDLSIDVGDLYEPVRGIKFDLIVAWPPVMPSRDVHRLTVHREINDGGPNGFQVLGRILVGLGNMLTKNGRLLTLLPWYLQEQTFNRIATDSGLVVRKLGSEVFPLGVVSMERLPDLCNSLDMSEADVIAPGQTMTVVAIKST